MSDASIPQTCPHCGAEFLDTTALPGSVVLYAACGKNFIRSGPAPSDRDRRRLQPTSPGVIERRFLGAALASWAGFLLLMCCSVWSLTQKSDSLQMIVGAGILCGYLPLLIAATVMGLGAARVPPESRRRIVIYIVLMWLPLGLTVLGSMVIPLVR